MTATSTTASNVIGSAGTSDATKAAQRNALRLFEKCLGQGTDEPWAGRTWDSLDESILCSHGVYESFAYFLTVTYIIEPGARNAGKHLAVETVLNTLGLVLNLARAKFAATGSDATKLFFTCLDSQSRTPHASWLRGLKINIRRRCFIRSRDAGEDTDQSATPIYFHHLEQITTALATKATPEAIKRRFMICGLWTSGGRSGEPAWVCFERMRYDPEFSSVVAILPQSKTAKMKLIAFVAGKRPTTCIFTAFAEYAAMVDRPPADQDGVSWLFDDFTGKEVGTYTKDVRPGRRSGVCRRRRRRPARGRLGGQFSSRRGQHARRPDPRRLRGPHHRPRVSRHLGVLRGPRADRPARDPRRSSPRGLARASVGPARNGAATRIVRSSRRASRRRGRRRGRRDDEAAPRGEGSAPSREREPPRDPRRWRTLAAGVGLVRERRHVVRDARSSRSDERLPHSHAPGVGRLLRRTPRSRSSDAHLCRRGGAQEVR